LWVPLANPHFVESFHIVPYAQSQEILQYSKIADVCLTSPNGNPTIYFDPDLSNQFLSGHTISWGGGMVMKFGMKPDILHITGFQNSKKVVISVNRFFNSPFDSVKSSIGQDT